MRRGRSWTKIENIIATTSKPTVGWEGGVKQALATTNLDLPSGKKLSKARYVHRTIRRYEDLVWRDDIFVKSRALILLAAIYTNNAGQSHHIPYMDLVRQQVPLPLCYCKWNNRASLYAAWRAQWAG